MVTMASKGFFFCFCFFRKWVWKCLWLQLLWKYPAMQKGPVPFTVEPYLCLQLDFNCWSMGTLRLLCTLRRCVILYFITAYIFVGKAKCGNAPPSAGTHTVKTYSVQQKKQQKTMHQRTSRSLIQALNLTSLALALCFQQTNNKRDLKPYCLQHGPGNSKKKQTSERLQKAAEMPFIKSWSVLLKRLPALPGSHVCILCFSYEFAKKQQQRGKQWRPEVRSGCLEQDRVWRCRGADELQVACWGLSGGAAVISIHPGEPGHTLCKHTPSSAHLKARTRTFTHKGLHRKREDENNPGSLSIYRAEIRRGGLK